MAENGAIDTTASQESMTDAIQTKHGQCVGMYVLDSPKSVQDQGEQYYIRICENITNGFNPRDWKCITQSDSNIVLVKRDLAKSYEIQLHDIFIISNFQHFTSSDNVSSKVEASAVEPCDCFDVNLIVKNILNSESIDQWVFFGKCHGTTYVSIADEKTSIPVEVFNQLETLVGQLRKIDNDVSNMIDTRIPLGETENNVTTVITTHVISQEDFFKEMNEMVFQKRKVLKQLNTLINKHCGTVLEGGKDSTTETHGSSNLASVQAYAGSSGNNEESRAVQTGSSIPLRTLLQCIATRMTASDWEELRRYVGRLIPLRVIRNVPSGIEFFQELENRDMIRIGNTEYIRNGLYDIERVDLVHLLDCIQEGDYSLLNADAITRTLDQRNRAEDRNDETRSQSLTREIGNLTVDGRRNENTADQNELWSTSSAQSTASQDRPLQRRYRNVPQRTTTSQAYPVQEYIEPANPTGANERPPETGTSASVEGTQEQPSANISNNDGSTSDQTTDASDSSIPGTNTVGLTPENTNSDGSQGTNGQSALPQGVNPESTPSRGENVEETWIESREFSCEHYDRYCKVQFACCDRFWPCHRCHNSQSQCGERKLRSRDIKKLKCRRCGKVQDFPKESPHCVECNLKFADYFCSICQHLTGTQNHPFHCNKCGICRVHGDRSFHCDVCGVCLDVNLRGNHRCREGSAHDECCICFEDAFTGCQILPCSHKVHKECASQMLRSGVTRCPMCKESFAHKVGKNKKI